MKHHLDACVQFFSDSRCCKSFRWFSIFLQCY